MTEEPLEPPAARAFLATTSAAHFATLAPDATPRWGAMSAQHMIEHLEQAMGLSMGEVRLPIASPPEKLPELLRFLRSGKPMPRQVVLPGAEGLSALKHPTLDAARAALSSATLRFLAGETAPGTVPAHPVFGPLSPDDWLRFHVTHVRHHLSQFGLAASEAHQDAQS